jgi:hypothetical protein
MSSGKLSFHIKRRTSDASSIGGKFQKKEIYENHRSYEKDQGEQRKNR